MRNIPESHGDSNPGHLNPAFLRRINALSVPEALMAYLGAGISVIPLRGKVPRRAWTPFQASCPTIAEGRGWVREFPDLGSIGFVTGGINGLVVLDSDTPEADQWLRDNAPFTSLVSITRKGFHRFYRPGKIAVPTGKGFGPIPGIDARGEGGYVVAPPSVVADHIYQWAWTENPVPVPTLDALGADFFVGAGGQGGGGDGSSLTGLVYGRTGLIIDGRESFITSRVMGIVSNFLRDNGYLPDPQVVADQMWGLCCQKVDLSDGKYSPAYCLEKAAYAIGRVRDGTIEIYPDGHVGDQEGYEA